MLIDAHWIRLENTSIARLGGVLLTHKRVRFPDESEVFLLSGDRVAVLSESSDEVHELDDWIGSTSRHEWFEFFAQVRI